MGNNAPITPVAGIQQKPYMANNISFNIGVANINTGEMRPGQNGQQMTFSNRFTESKRADKNNYQQNLEL